MDGTDSIDSYLGEAEVDAWRPDVWRISGSLTVTGAGLLTASLVPQYLANSEARWHPWVASTVLLVLVVAAAGVILLRSRRTLGGAGLIVGFVGGWAPGWLADIGAVISAGSRTVGVEFVLFAAGLVCVVLGGVTALRGALPVVFRWHSAKSLLIAGATLLITAVGFIGDGFRWVEIRAQATVAGYRFPTSGTSHATQSCCSFAQLTAWSLAGAIMVGVTASFLGLLFGLVLPRQFAVWGIAGVGLAFTVRCAHPLAEVLLGPTVPDVRGLSRAGARRAGIALSAHGLPGLWVSISVALALVVLAFLRARLEQTNSRIAA